MTYASDNQDHMDALRPPGHHYDCLQRDDKKWFFRYGQCMCETLRGPHTYCGVVRHKGVTTVWKSNKPIKVVRG